MIIKAIKTPTLHAGLAPGGGTCIWDDVLLDSLDFMRQIVPAGSQVLEVGYGDGVLSCYLCQQLGWKLTGLETSKTTNYLAVQHAKQFGLSEQVDFRLCQPNDTFRHRGQYDAVFIKTVLYNSPDLEEYGRWLDWIISVLRPGGVLVNFETGRANALIQLYRRVQRRSYIDRCLYSSRAEALYDERFEIIHRRYYGGWSQFFAPVTVLYRMAARLEKTLRVRNADNCFIVSIIARRPV